MFPLPGSLKVLPELLLAGGEGGGSLRGDVSDRGRLAADGGGAEGTMQGEGADGARGQHDDDGWKVGEVGDEGEKRGREGGTMAVLRSTGGRGGGQQRRG